MSLWGAFAKKNGSASCVFFSYYSKLLTHSHFYYLSYPAPYLISLESLLPYFLKFGSI